MSILYQTFLWQCAAVEQETLGPLLLYCWTHNITQNAFQCKEQWGKLFYLILSKPNCLKYFYTELLMTIE